MRHLNRVLVTGGAGLLVTRLCGRLLAGGAQRVICLDDLSTSLPADVAEQRSLPGLDFVAHNITEELENPRIFGPLDAVFHLASPVSPPDYLRLPIATLRSRAYGTSVAFDIAEQCHARCMLASTSEVYGDPLVHLQSETYWGNVNPVGLRSVYDEAKRFAEALTFAHHRANGADIAVARIFDSYGPGMRADDGRMVPTFCCQALHN